jgi:Tol biopolymer transport system component
MRRALHRRAVGAFLLAAGALLAGAEPLEAQYFGRNNPQYRTFDFQVLRTQHFDVHFYPEAEQGARDAARMAERWYARLSSILEHEFTARQPLILYASHADFQQTNILSSPVGEGTGGVTESAKQRVIMPLANTYAATDHVLGHEIVHAFQYDLSGLGRSAGSVDAGGRALATAPLWFIEGMAEYLTVGPVDAHTAMWLRDASLTGRLPTLRQLERDPRIFPYRYGHAVWAYVTGRWGDAAVGQILRQVGQGVPYDQAMQRVLNVSLDQLSEDWQAAVRSTYLPLLGDRREARETATPLVTAAERGGRLNLAPALSPDGSLMAFLSERGRLDVELWLANAETGEVLRRLVRGTSFDPHFASLNFIASAGTFSPDAAQVAFAALRAGRDVLALVDVQRGGVTREIPLPGISELTNPAWSPDGRSIAVSGTVGGISNLYLVDVASGAVRPLTSGRNADLMPSWSPDGSTLAFVTDRGEGTDFDALRYGGYRIALLDVATGEMRLLPREAGTRDFNPVWSADGTALHFISDRTGIANVYRMELASGQVTPVTRLFQGVSGITELSPALSGARTANRLVFSAFERGGYNLYRLDGAAELQRAAVALPPAEAVWELAALPPTPRSREAPFQRVTAYLADHATGLPSAAVANAWTPEPYRPRLTLDYLGQPMIGVSTGGGVGGGGLYGGIAAVWSDMLGRHTVFGQLQAQGELDETGFAVAYIHRRPRWDLGGVVQRIPYISGGARRVYDPGTDLIRDQVVTFRTFDNRLQALAQRPFSRARRLEFSAGLRRLSRDVRIREIVYDPVRDGQGEIIGGTNPRQQSSREPVDALNLVEGATALVYDNALFGYTSPFAGQRYRLELAPTAGDLRFLSALADYRRYVWLRPLTFAVRGLHFGRYGMDAAEEAMVGPIFLGYPSLVRGYPQGAVADRCVADLQGGMDTSEACRLYEQLFGSRIGVANLELRVPLLRPGGGGGMGMPPVEGFGFYDAGVAWGRGSLPVFGAGVQPIASERGFLSSAGLGARVNLFGYAIAEVAYVRPFAGDLGWRWHLALQPGF